MLGGGDRRCGPNIERNSSSGSLLRHLGADGRPDPDSVNPKTQSTARFADLPHSQILQKFPFPVEDLPVTGSFARALLCYGHDHVVHAH